MKFDKTTNFSQISGSKPENNFASQTRRIKSNKSQKANHYFGSQMTFKNAKFELFGFQKSQMATLLLWFYFVWLQTWSLSNNLHDVINGCVPPMDVL